MTSDLNRIEQALLTAVVADLDRLRRGQPVPGVEGWTAIQEAKEDARHGYVRMATARWLGVAKLVPAARMAAARAFAGLERRKLVERKAMGWATERANYLYVTRAGRKLAKQLVATTING